MFSNPSLFTRIAVGKSAGLVIGFAGFVVMPWIWPEADTMTRWGVLFWYTTFGVVIGFAGVFDRHPVLRLPLRWWLRGPLFGAWLNFVLVFFAWQPMTAMLTSLFGDNAVLTAPWWFVLEGALVGLLIDWLATRFGGEGSAAAAGGGIDRHAPEA